MSAVRCVSDAGKTARRLANIPEGQPWAGRRETAPYFQDSQAKACYAGGSLTFMGATRNITRSWSESRKHIDKDERRGQN
jgi:hypothetical protein